MINRHKTHETRHQHYQMIFGGLMPYYPLRVPDHTHINEAPKFASIDREIQAFLHPNEAFR